VICKRAQSGAALVEFALTTPLLMLLLIGIIEIGRFAYFSILVGNAAHAGAFYGSQSLTTAGDTSGMQTAVLNDGQSISGLSASPAPTIFFQCWNGTTAQASTTATCSQTGYHAVEYVQVSATGRFNSMFNWPGLPQQMNLTRTAIMRVLIDRQ
jgi:Flp pilus assembly protein TadG